MVLHFWDSTRTLPTFIHSFIHNFNLRIIFHSDMTMTWLVIITTIRFTVTFTSNKHRTLATQILGVIFESAVLRYNNTRIEATAQNSLSSHTVSLNVYEKIGIPDNTSSSFVAKLHFNDLSNWWWIFPGFNISSPTLGRIIAKICQQTYFTTAWHMVDVYNCKPTLLGYFPSQAGIFFLCFVY